MRLSESSEELSDEERSKLFTLTFKPIDKVVKFLLFFPVHSCSAKLSKAKKYVVDSQDITSSWHTSTCSLYIQAPPKHLIRISVTELAVGCDRNRLKVISFKLVRSRIDRNSNAFIVRWSTAGSFSTGSTELISMCRWVWTPTRTECQTCAKAAVRRIGLSSVPRITPTYCTS